MYTILRLCLFALIFGGFNSSAVYASLFQAKFDRSKTPKPIFVTRTLSLGAGKNPPQLSLPLPNTWSQQNETESASGFDIQFYPPKQNMNYASDVIRIEALKMLVPNTKNDVAKISDLILKRAQLGGQVKILERLEYVQNGRQTLEILLESLVQGTKDHRVLTLIKLIPAPSSEGHLYGLISLSKISLQIFNDRDYAVAKREIELYRDAFRKLQFVNWGSTSVSGALIFENRIFNVGTGADKSRISAYVPKDWLLEVSQNTDQVYAAELSPHNAKESLIARSVVITVAKTGVPITDYGALEGAYLDIAKRHFAKEFNNVKFLHLLRYEQDGLKTIEYIFEAHPSPELIALCMNKEIATSSGLVSLRGCVTTYDANTRSKLDAELNSYREQFRKIKLLDWSPPLLQTYTKPIFRDEMISMDTAGGLGVSFRVPVNWEQKPQSANNGDLYEFGPINTVAGFGEKLELQFIEGDYVFDKKGFTEYCDKFISVLKKRRPSTKFYNQSEVLELNGAYAFTYESDWGIEDYYHTKVISVMISPKGLHDSKYSVVHLHKFSSVFTGSQSWSNKWDEDFSYYRDEFKKTKFVNLGNIEINNDFNTRVIPFFSDLQGTSLSLSLPTSWVLKETLEQEPLIQMLLRPSKDFYGVSENVKLTIFKQPFPQSFKGLQGQVMSIKNSRMQLYNGIEFFPDLELEQNGLRVIEFRSVPLLVNGSEFSSLDTVIATGSERDNNYGLIHLKYNLVYDLPNEEFRETRIAQFQEAFRNLGLINWPGKASKEVKFKTEVIKLSDALDAPQFAIRLPEDWKFTEKHELEKMINFTFKPEHEDKLLPEAVIVSVYKGYFSNTLATLERVTKELRDWAISKYPMTKFRDIFKASQNGYHSSECLGSEMKNEHIKKVFFEKVITTGSKDFGVVRIQKHAVLDLDFQSEQKYLEQEKPFVRELHELRLINWTPGQ